MTRALFSAIAALLVSAGMCAPEGVIERTLMGGPIHERALFEGDGAMNDEGGLGIIESGSRHVLWGNEDAGSWTITTSVDGRTCVNAFGLGMILGREAVFVGYLSNGTKVTLEIDSNGNWIIYTQERVGEALGPPLLRQFGINGVAAPTGPEI